MPSDGAVAAGAVIVVAAGAAGAYLALKPKTATAKASMIEPDGTHTTKATYGPGDTRQLSTVVPPSTHPVSIQAFRTNPDGSDTPSSLAAWDVAATGYDYIFETSEALSPGAYSVYTVVHFADGSTATSNTCTFTMT